MVNKLIRKIMYPNSYSSETYIKYIKNRGGKIGKNCHFYSPNTISIDLARPYLIDIGDNVIITKGVTILTHDYSHTVIRKKYGTNIGDAQGVKIGNNVFIGLDSIILMGTVIGDNVIIGAHSVVRGNIPDNVVVSGNPAKVICTIEDFYKKRKEKQLERAIDNVKKCRDRFHRNPTIREMGDAFFWLYMPRNEKSINDYPDFFNLPGENAERLKKDFLDGHSDYQSYDDFLKSIK